MNWIRIDMWGNANSRINKWIFVGMILWINTGVNAWNNVRIDCTSLHFCWCRSPIEYRSCECLIKNDNHLFQCPRQPQFLRCIQSIINDIRDTLKPKLYHLLKHHLTAYIQGRDLLSITTMALTHERRVSRSSLFLNLVSNV